MALDIEYVYCHPGDDNRQRWILMFDDADVTHQIYYDEDKAHEAFDTANVNWNCHLMTSVPRRIK